MHIGVDIRSLMERQYSGVAEYTLNLLNALLALDQENKYYLFYNSLKDVELPQFKGKNVKLCGFKYPNKLFNLGLKLWDKWQVDQMIGGVDVFWLPNQQFINLSNKCHKVITFHDLSFERYPEFFSFKRKRWHEVINPKKLAKSFNHLIAVSKSTKNDLMDFYGIKDEKISVIHSGLNEIFSQEISDEKKNRVKDKYNLPDRFIMYLGTLEPRKNVIGLIEAFNRIKSQTKLIIAGGKGWLYKDIYKAANHSPKKGSIKFLGYVEDKDRPALYSLAELFVFPSYCEGFGFPVLEAMASGTPVITSASSSLPEITNNTAILTNPYNLNELAQVMDQVLLSEELKNSLREKGRDWAKKFSWQEAANKTLEVFKNL